MVFVLMALMAWWRAERRPELLKMSGGTALGIAGPLGLVVAYFVYHEAYADYIYYAFTFNTEVYLPEVPFWERMRCIRMPFVMAWENVATIGLLGVAGGIALLIRVSKHMLRASTEPFPL